MSAASVTYLTPPQPVSMGDEWFDIATVDHFWMRRRFEVLGDLAGPDLSAADQLAEIGCGHGVLQHQIYRRFGKEVDGFDLNEIALRKSIAPPGRVFCYDIGQRHADLAEKYDVVLLFDVIEHIDDEQPFIRHVLHHLKPGGQVIVNVPALNALYSAYDVAAGHCRRYTRNRLSAPFEQCGMIPRSSVYWGLPFVPIALLRKAMLALRRGDDRTVLRNGFRAPSPAANAALGAMARWEHVSWNPLGTSVMAAFVKPA